MVQGKTKGLQKGAPKSSQNPTQMKKGRRNIPPKKPQLIKQAAMKRDLTAKINRSIEGQMVSAASSGKLTIMKNTIPEGSSSKFKAKAGK